MTHLSLSIALALASALPRPPSGVEIDETRIVAARRAVPVACFAYVNGSGSLLVQGEGILKAASSPQRTWRTEAERLVYIHASRARELVSASQPNAGPHGCRLVSPSVSMDGLTLLLEEVEAGRAAAESAKGVLAPALVIRYHGTRCGPLCGVGMITVSLPGGKRPLLEVMWWQA